MPNLHTPQRLEKETFEAYKERRARSNAAAKAMTQPGIVTGKFHVQNRNKGKDRSPGRKARVKAIKKDKVMVLKFRQAVAAIDPELGLAFAKDMNFGPGPFRQATKWENMSSSTGVGSNQVS